MLPSPAVLIIRPKKQAALLACAIEAKGWRTVLFPTLEIVPPPDIALAQQQLNQLSHYDILLFCTANAVEHSLHYLKDLACRIHPSKQSVLAIGTSTAHALEQAAITVEAVPEKDYSSEGLLALPQLQQVKGKHIAIIAGTGGRELLEKTLTARGAQVIKIDTYSRRCPSADKLSNDLLLTWQQAGVEIIVGSSFSSLENLYLLTHRDFHPWLLSKQILVVSQRMQEKAFALGFRHFIKAQNATDKAIIKALDRKLSKLSK